MMSSSKAIMGPFFGMKPLVGEQDKRLHGKSHKRVTLDEAKKAQSLLQVEKALERVDKSEFKVSDVTKLTTLSQPTVNNIMRKMVQEEKLFERENYSNGRAIIYSKEKLK